MEDLASALKVIMIMIQKFVNNVTLNVSPVTKQIKMDVPDVHYQDIN